MRVLLGDEVERCRVAGPANGGPYGAFKLVHPDTGRTLYVIASDGRDWAEEELPGTPWEHVSVSATTVPMWAEMCWLKDVFWGPDEWVVQYHPAVADYVNHHPRTLHLWRPAGGGFPTPPKECV